MTVPKHLGSLYTSPAGLWALVSLITSVGLRTNYWLRLHANLGDHDEITWLTLLETRVDPSWTVGFRHLNTLDKPGSTFPRKKLLKLVKRVKKDNGFWMTKQSNANFVEPQGYRHKSWGQSSQLGLVFPFLTQARVNVTEASTQAGNLTRIDRQPGFV